MEKDISQKELNMDRLSGDLIEKIAFILGDLKVFHALLNATPALIRHEGSCDRAQRIFIKIRMDYNNWTRGWVLNGMPHMYDDKPAVICMNGHKEWWYHGKRHREGGKEAVLFANGTKRYFIKGEERILN